MGTGLVARLITGTAASWVRLPYLKNIQVNEIYERYVPSSWTKPTPDADQHLREQWILAKYKHR